MLNFKKKRANELLEKTITYLCDNVKDNQKLYKILHYRLKLTNKEIEEVGIDYLKDYYE